MAVYLIDTENVANDWVAYLPQSVKGDMFLIFYTQSSSHLDLSILGKILKSPGKFECIPCYRGTNALDFQLVSELGFRIARHPLHEYIIVSRDTGFDAAVKYWTERNIKIRRWEPAHLPKKSTKTSTAKKEKESPSQSKCKDTYLQKLRGNGVGEDEILKIIDLMMSSMRLPQNQRRADVYKRMCASFGHTEGLQLYQKVKQPIKEIAENGPFPG